MTESNLKVYVVELEDGKCRVAIGDSVADAFKNHGGIPEEWHAFQRYGMIKAYSIREWFSEQRVVKI